MKSKGVKLLVLAGGSGRRFTASGGSGSKLDAMLGNHTVLDHVLRAADASGLEWAVVRPKAPTDGMGRSIALGLQANRDSAGWLILPGDLPLIQPESISEVARQLQQSVIVVPWYRQTSGHPVGFASACADHLVRLTGDQGAKCVVQHYRKEGLVRDIPLEDEGAVLDVDTMDDLARLRARMRKRTSP